MHTHLNALEQMLIPRTSTANNGRRTSSASTSPNYAAPPQQPAVPRLQPPVPTAAPVAAPVFPVVEPLGLPNEFHWGIIVQNVPVYVPGQGIKPVNVQFPVAQGAKQMMAPPSHERSQQMPQGGQMHPRVVHVAPPPQRAEELLREAALRQELPIQRVPVSQPQPQANGLQADCRRGRQGVPRQPQMQLPPVPPLPPQYAQPQAAQHRSPTLADALMEVMAPTPAPQQMQPPVQQYQPPQLPSPTLRGVCPNILAGSARRKRSRPQKDTTQAAKRPMPPLRVPDLPPLKENFSSRSPHAA